ncbi:MAG: YggT family protein [Nitrospirae bacterium]|nr:YggT family protein [Nitrospirota bacterium]MBI5695246.1 YggT family protein [Nitrospirota bacterium]
MFALGYFIDGVVYVLDTILEVYFWMIVANAVLSWVNPDPYNPIVRFLYSATEPVLRPIRRRLPMLGIDFSPLIVCVAIKFLQIFLVGTLRHWAIGLH